jgi:DNA primase (bacterial type)
MTMLDHLRSRAIEPARYHLHYDEETTCFYLFNLTGQFVGYQQYRPAADKTRKNDPKLGRYFNYVLHGPEKGSVNAVWGLETFGYRSDVLFIVEGIFDAAKLHNQGLPAIAALANDPKHIRPWLRIIRQTRVIIGVSDNDAAGSKLKNSVDINLQLSDSKDLGDMSNDEVRNFLCKNEIRL